MSINWNDHRSELLDHYQSLLTDGYPLINEFCFICIALLCTHNLLGGTLST